MAKNLMGGYYMIDLSDVSLQDDESGMGAAEFRGEPGKHPELYAALSAADKPVMLVNAPSGCGDTDGVFHPATVRSACFVGSARNFNDQNETYEYVFLVTGQQALYVISDGTIGITTVA